MFNCSSFVLPHFFFSTLFLSRTGQWSVRDKNKVEKTRGRQKQPETEKARKERRKNQKGAQEEKRKSRFYVQMASQGLMTLIYFPTTLPKGYFTDYHLAPKRSNREDCALAELNINELKFHFISFCGEPASSGKVPKGPGWPPGPSTTIIGDTYKCG